MTDLELSGRNLGEFLVRERIGVGGHGVVYRCEQRELGRDAVVKVLRARPGDYAGTERFVREARLASQLEHPFSAHVYAFGVEDDGVRWIAMEFVRGVTLGAYLKARGPMPLAEFVPFFERIAEVVHAAHERGIVHRDLKPSNVMVIESGGRLFPKLLDFGIAKVLDAAGGSDEEAHEDRAPDRAAITTSKLRLAPPSYRTHPAPTRNGAPHAQRRDAGLDAVHVPGAVARSAWSRSRGHVVAGLVLHLVEGRHQLVLRVERERGDPREVGPRRIDVQASLRREDDQGAFRRIADQLAVADDGVRGEDHRRHELVERYFGLAGRPEEFPSVE